MLSIKGLLEVYVQIFADYLKYLYQKAKYAMYPVTEHKTSDNGIDTNG